MKRFLALVLGTAILSVSALSLAQDAKAPGMSGKAAAASAMPSMAQMDEHMKKMQGLHERMMSAATPEARQKVMEEARKEMQETMAMMQPMMQGGGMMGGGMAGGGMAGGGMAGGGMAGGGMAGGMGKPGEAQDQLQMMGKRVDMMQMMMQMMLDQQGMPGSPK